MDRSRHPAGTPTGGRFAPDPHAEASGVNVDDASATRAVEDDEYRLEVTDEEAITRRVTESIDLWRSTSMRPGGIPNDANTVDALVRVGASSIGYAPWELRDSEIAWITERAQEAAAS